MTRFFGPHYTISAYAQDYELRFSIPAKLDTLISNIKLYFQYLTDIPRQREEYEVIYGKRQNAECHITSILRAGMEYLFYFMTSSLYVFVT